MMNIQYHKWLDVEVTNSYFAEGVCPVFKLIPFPDIAERLRNYNILIQKKNNIFSFYTGIPQETTFDIATAFSTLNDLYFQLVLEDTLFFSYTGIPSLEAQQIFYFINSETATTLQKSLFVSEKDIVDYRPQNFNLALPEGDVTIEIKNIAGDIVRSFNFSDTKNGVISMNHQPIGIYEILLNEKKTDSFFYANTALAESSIGILQLNIKQLIEHDTNTSKLTLDFDAREVYWQYQVIVPSSRKITVTTMVIKGVENENYKDPFEKQIVGGQTAKVFTSSMPLKLQSELLKNPELKLTYINDQSNISDDLDLKLPNPSAENLIKYNNQQNEDALCATTIVYV